MVYWGTDAKKDLIVGEAEGKIKLYTNVGSEAAPTFDGGIYLQVGPAGSKVDIDVGQRTTIDVVDWNNDGRRDLVVGSKDGKISLFLNSGTDTAPDYLGQTMLQEGGADLVVPSLRASPVVLDLDWDGKKDLLAGNTDGKLLFYPNTGTDAAPTFSGHSFVMANGVEIDLDAPGRSRPFVCDWTGDGERDVLIGDGDGMLHLFQGKLSLLAVEQSRLGTPPNPSALLPGQTSGPVIGAVWDPVIDHTAFLPTATLDLLFLSPLPVNIALGPPLGTLLCDILVAPPVVYGSGPGVPFALAIPPNTNFVGKTLSAQGLSTDGLNAQFTNALDLTVGTH